MKSLVVGVIVCGMLMLLAFALMHLPFVPFTLVSGAHPIEGATIALILGLMLGPSLRGMGSRGVRFCKGYILSLGVILLGTQLDVRKLAHLPHSLIVVMLLVVLLMMLVSLVLGRWCRLPFKVSCLVGLGTAICGSSAIMAGQRVVEAEDSQLAVSLAVINILGLCLIFILPLIATWVQMGPSGFGVWSGLSIQAVPQVVAAALTFSVKAAPMATLVKLVRVLMLGPVLCVLKLILAWQSSNQSQHASSSPRAFLQSLFSFVPPFIVLFFLAVVLGGWHGLDARLPVLEDHSLRQLFWLGSQGCLAMALVAIGLDVNFIALKNLGARVFFLAGCLTVLLVVVCYYVVYLYAAML